MELHNHGTHIEIIRRWWKWFVLPQTLWVIFWNGFLLVMFIMFSVFLFQGPPSFSKLYEFISFPSIPCLFPLIFPILFPGLFIWIGVTQAQDVAFTWLNKTHIYLSPTTLITQCKPFARFNPNTIATSDIEYLSIKECANRGHNIIRYTYEIQVILHNGASIIIDKDLTLKEQAFFVQDEIEKYLNIEKRGEFQESVRW